MPVLGNERPHRVFIVGPNFAEIACLAENYIQHERRYLETVLIQNPNVRAL
jgi:hypothetical protein